MAAKRQLHDSVNQTLSTENFYIPDIDHTERAYQAESERLDVMATIADSMSIEAIKKTGIPLSGMVVVDIGAGDSTSLGTKLQSDGVRYVPIDQRIEALSVHQRRFPAARIGDVTNFSNCLTLQPDVVHARFVYAWLTDNQRTMALAESLRSFNDSNDAHLVIIDYDWSVTQGPDPYIEAIEAAVNVMRSMGFKPDYGRASISDIRDKLQELNHHNSDEAITIQTERYRLKGYATLESALDIVRLTAKSFIERLDALGMVDKSHLLSCKLLSLENYAADHPEEAIVLPDIVAVEAHIRNPSSFVGPNYRTLFRLIQQAGTYDPLTCVFRNISPLPDTRIALSDTAKLVARRIQAAAYYTDGIITSDVVAPDGALIRASDSADLVARSDYITTGEEGRARVTARLISSIGNDPSTLPTMQRLKLSSPDAHRYLVEEKFGYRDESVVEVSGLGKVAGGSISELIDTVLGLGLHALSKRHKHAIMGLQESHFALIRHLFGSDAIQVIPTGDAAHPVHLPGFNSQLRFFAIYVDVENFLHNVARHAERHQGAGLVGIVHQRIKYIREHEARIFV